MRRVLSFLIDMVLEKQFIAMLAGAFLAALFGQRSMSAIARQERQRTIKKYSKLLYNELNDLILTITFLKYDVELLVESNAENTWNLMEHKIMSLKDHGQWQEYLAELNDILPSLHIKKVKEVFLIALRIPYAFQEQDLHKLRKLLSNFFAEETGRELRETKEPIFSLTIDELLDDLIYLGITGKVRNRKLNYWLNEFKYRKYYSEAKDNIESLVVEWLSEETKLSAIEVEERLTKWLSRTERRFQRKYNSNWKRIIYYTLLNSRKIEYVWGECYLSPKVGKINQAG